MEKRYIRSDGQTVWALLAVSLVRDAEGQPLYFISQVEDISGLKRSEAENNRLVERITLANRGRRRHLGMGDEPGTLHRDQRMFELYDLNPDQTPTLALWRTLLVPEDRERTDRELAALLANPKPFVMEFRITTRGGKLRHIRGQGNVILDDQGRPLRMIGTNIDMTELKISLRRCTKKRAPAHHPRRHRRRGDLHRQPPAHHLYEPSGRADVRLAARPGDRYAHRRRGAPDQRQRRPGNRKPHAIPAAGPADYALVLHSRDGRYFDVQQSVSPLKTLDGETMGAVMVLQDVTASRELMKSSATAPRTTR